MKTLTPILLLLATACRSTPAEPGAPAPTSVLLVEALSEDEYLVDGRKLEESAVIDVLIEIAGSRAAAGLWAGSEVRVRARDPQRTPFDALMPAVIGYVGAVDQYSEINPETALTERLTIQGEELRIWSEHRFCHLQLDASFEPFSLRGNESDAEFARLFERTSDKFVQLRVRPDASVTEVARALATLNRAGTDYVISIEVPADGSRIHIAPFLGEEEPEEEPASP